jgi:putative membrane protein insertion efficiency factor
VIVRQGEDSAATPIMTRMASRAHRILWVSGWPARAALVALVRLYRVLLGPALGGGCKFYPSCSHYAEGAIRSRGAVVGLGLSVWRLLRCHPWSLGGIDHPPAARARRSPQAPSPVSYEGVLHSPGAPA